MIKINLDKKLKEKGVSQRQLAIKLDVRPNTINDMARDQTKMFSRQMLDDLCRELECQPGDLIEYIPDK